MVEGATLETVSPIPYEVDDLKGGYYISSSVNDGFSFIFLDRLVSFEFCDIYFLVERSLILMKFRLSFAFLIPKKRPITKRRNK